MNKKEFKELNIAQSDISKCCAGIRKSAGNYIWLNDDGLLKELEKKDKMIDLMSKSIRAYDIDEDICQYQGICNEYECEECIKHHFENKANEGE